MAVLQYGMAMPLNSDTMASTRTHNSPNYLLFHTLRWMCKVVKALTIYAIRIAKAILVSIVYVWGIITDWIVHFTVVRMLIFPLIYKIPYKYILDKEGWAVRKRWLYKCKPKSCQCFAVVCDRQITEFEALENIFGHYNYYDMCNMRLVIEYRIDARRKRIREIAFKTLYHSRDSSGEHYSENMVFSDRTLSKIEHWARWSYIRYYNRKLSKPMQEYTKYQTFFDFGEFTPLKSYAEQNTDN